MLVLAVLGVRHPFALLSLGLCTFVTTTIVMEFFKGANTIRRKNNFNFIRSVIELTHRNTRRYGGYLVHMGIVLMFVGFAGAAFNLNRTIEAKLGDSFTIGRYQLKVRELRQGDTPNYSWDHAVIEVSTGGRAAGRACPRNRSRSRAARS